MWIKKKNQTFELLCTLKYKDILENTLVQQLPAQDIPLSSQEDEATDDSKENVKPLLETTYRGAIRGFQPDFLYKDKSFGLCVVYDDFITIWNEKDYSLVSEYKLAKQTDYVIHKVVFDGKGKRVALHTSDGLKVIDVELQEELWKLGFKSITDVQSSDFKNSQFFITMNSEDAHDSFADTLIVFSFRSSKPLKMVKFPAADHITSGRYVNLNNLDSPSICLITSKGFIQYINCIKRGESTSQTRMDLIKKENSLTSPAITPMINFGDLDEEIEEFQLDQSKYKVVILNILGTKITTNKQLYQHDFLAKASDMYFSKAKVYSSSIGKVFNEYLDNTLPKLAVKESLAK